AVAGSFYPANPDDLRRMIARMTTPDARRTKALAVIAPHAGYVYSGAVAGAVYSSVEIPASCLVLAPAHRPTRTLFALMEEGLWETPLATIPIDAGLAKDLRSRCPLVQSDPAAHAEEHSLEVQLPFLQYFRPDVSIVPVNVSYRAGLADLEALGRAAAQAIQASGKDVLLVASTDMSHYLSASAARELDVQAIDRILALDPEGLVKVVRQEDISMCGVLPTAAALFAARILGAGRAELIRYATSGDVTGDDREVVAYAGLVIA
ncbi:MAG: AmmeMemoRadiSam system protein B, partial [Candidatus Aminicenantes bacterium]|nr:AmmeMemoRadiSam system protein B [Candidatus Aminicenantes bacterium]